MPNLVKEIELNQSLYTFIMDYRGGIYISQVHATSVANACIDWATNLDTKEIKYFGVRMKEALETEVKEAIETNDIGTIDGTTNVFICCLSLLGHFTLIHIIKTVDNERSS